MMWFKLDRPVALERATSATNALNERIVTWEALGCVMAQRSYKNAGERVAIGEQVSATLISRYIVRWAAALSDLNPKDRLRDNLDNRVYDIKGVYELGRQRWLEIHCAARAD